MIASVEEHKQEFGIPPSLAWICKPEGKVAQISQMAAPSMQAGQGTPSQAGRKKQNRRKSRKKQVPPSDFGGAVWFQTLVPSRGGGISAIVMEIVTSTALRESQAKDAPIKRRDVTPNSSAQLVGAAHMGVAGLHGGFMENCASWQITGIASATTRRSEALPQR